MSQNLSAGFLLAEELLSDLSAQSFADPGHTRDAYGQKEQMAHDLMKSAGERLGAAARVDGAGNLYLTLPGSRPDLPAIFIGSHLDTVPHGGNFDGAAGVVAGLGVMAELAEAGLTPTRNLTVMVTRSEEAAWFPLSYPGSRAAFGLLSPEELEAPRSDTGRTLADHMAEAGFDAEAVRAGTSFLDPASLAAFVEVHIEQGPRLIAKDMPVGIVTGIAGGCRFVRAKVLGDYGHSGAEPRFARHDAVVGFADLVQGLEEDWDAIEAKGGEATITFGRVESDPSQHGGSRILGELGFTLDLRSGDPDLLLHMQARVAAHCEKIAAKRGLTFDLGAPFFWDAARMDGGLIKRLQRAATPLGLAPPLVPSGAGHDAVTFATMGIPTAMLFVRNHNGSHNPHEAMETEDLHQAIRLLTRFVLEFDQEPPQENAP